MATHLLEYPDLMAEHESGELELRYWPNPVLGEASESVSPEEFGAEIMKLGTQMIALMQKAKGAGLAAPQVGLLKRVFVMSFPNHGHDPEEPAIICNPVILEESAEGSFAVEGCLSLPGIHQQVWRPSEIFLAYQDPAGTPGKMVLLEEEARIAHHEIDHLNGVMFFSAERMTRKYRQVVEAQWRKLGQDNVRIFRKNLATGA